jgi:hypothetical protein
VHHPFDLRGTAGTLREIPMNFARTSALLLVVIVFGMGFSGYLAASVLLSSTCPLNGGCTMVFGYPSCMYGFTMYTIMLIILMLTWLGTVAFLTGRKLILIVSVIGMLFAGSLLIEEYTGNKPITICAVGFVMYLLILLISQFMWKKD